MSGTKAGSIKAMAKILAKNPNHFRDIGRIGGKKSGSGGFYYMKVHGQVNKIKEAGKKGGKVSKRSSTRIVNPIQEPTAAVNSIPVNPTVIISRGPSVWDFIRRKR